MLLMERGCWLREAAPAENYGKGVPMNVAFIAPSYPAEQRDFTRGLAEVGATVIGIGDGAVEGLHPRVKRYLSHYIRVPQLFNERAAAADLAPQLAALSVDRVAVSYTHLTLPTICSV